MSPNSCPSDWARLFWHSAGQKVESFVIFPSFWKACRVGYIVGDWVKLFKTLDLEIFSYFLKLPFFTRHQTLPKFCISLPEMFRIFEFGKPSNHTRILFWKDGRAWIFVQEAGILSGPDQSQCLILIFELFLNFDFYVLYADSIKYVFFANFLILQLTSCSLSSPQKLLSKSFFVWHFFDYVFCYVECVRFFDPICFDQVLDRFKLTIQRIRMYVWTIKNPFICLRKFQLFDACFIIKFQSS